MLNKENYTVAELSELLLFVSRIRKEKPNIAINDYHQASTQLDIFCKTLDIENTSFYKDRSKKIYEAGLSAVYKSVSPDLRLLSSNDNLLPDLPIIDLTDNDTITGGNEGLPRTADNNKRLYSSTGGNDE